jgi:6-phosphogluconolactonase (cycloisomerase 2 family)
MLAGPDEGRLGLIAKRMRALHAASVVAIAGAAVLFGLVSAGARRSPPGVLTPKGCIDDNDTATDPEQGEDGCARSTNGLHGAKGIVVSADGRSAYAVSGEDDAIVRFKRNTRTGALKPKGCIDDNDTATDPEQGPDNCAQSTNGLAGAEAVAASGDGRSVYAVSGEDDAVVRFKRNRRTGALKPRGCIDDNDTATDPSQGEDNCAQSANGLNSPQSVTVSPDGKSVYVTGEVDDAIVRFKRNRRTGALKPRGCIDDNDRATDPSQGEDHCAKSTNGLNTVTATAVTRDGRWLYAISDLDDAIVRFKRSTRTGALKPKGCIDDNDTATDSTQGEDNCAQSAGGLHGGTSIAVSRDGKSLYAASEEDAAIVRFKRNVRTGALRPKGCIQDNEVADGDCSRSTKGLEGLESVTLSRDGKSLYSVAEDDDAIVRFDRDPDTGSIKPNGCIDDNDNVNDRCARSTNGLSSAASLAISRDGKSVYGAGEEDDAIVRFRRAR